MNDHELDALLRRSASVTDSQLEDIPPLSAARAELCAAILRSDQTAPAAPHSDQTPARSDVLRRWSPMRAGPRRFAVAACAAAIIATGAAAGFNGSFGGGPSTAWSAEAVQFAKASPRFLISGQDYVVTRADQSGGTGEMTFAPRSPSGTKAIIDVARDEDGDRLGEILAPRPEIQVRWSDASLYASQIAGLGAEESDLTDLGTTDALGRPVRWFTYAGTNRFRAVWVHDDRMIEVDGIAADRDAFAAILDRLILVDVDTWLRAMPDSVVKPAVLKESIETMLADIPLPPDWTNTAVQDSVGTARDRYQLGAAVTGSVACGWIAEWADARKSANPVRMKAAAAAMNSSRSWQILREMDAEGAYPEVIWDYADVMNGRRDAAASGQKLAKGELGDYRSALGCRNG